MKIDTNAFLQSLPIMGVGLLGIFIVTIVIIIGIYILRALTAKSAEKEKEDEKASQNSIKDSGKAEKAAKGSWEKESAMDLFTDKQKKDFFETEDKFDISQDL